MRLTALLFCLSTALLAGTCKPDLHTTPELQHLQRTWLHAHEEDSSDVLVYRPNTYSFKPSRGRTGFAFEHNGLFTQYDIAPTDGLEGRKGRWEALNDHTLRITLDDKKDPDYRLEILSITPERLRVRRLEDKTGN